MCDQANKNTKTIVSQLCEEMENTCSICLCEMSLFEASQIDPCKHSFHTACINRWKQVANSCPMCRSEMGSEIIYNIKINYTKKYINTIRTLIEN